MAPSWVVASLKLAGRLLLYNLKRLHTQRVRMQGRVSDLPSTRQGTGLIKHIQVASSTLQTALKDVSKRLMAPLLSSYECSDE